MDIGANVLLLSAETVSLCNDKVKSNQRANNINIPVPDISADPNEDDLPIFSKLIEGSSSKGAVLIEDGLLLDWYKEEKCIRIFQQYIKGGRIYCRYNL